MIEIQNIERTTIDGIINLLLDEKKQPFDIYIPKSTLLYHSTSEDIANDYATLAYIGQKLSEVSESFSYDYVSPHVHESVLFQVETTNFVGLAEVILELSYEYNNESEDTEESYFLDDVYQFIDDVENNKITPACQDFLDTYYEFKKEIEEEENSD